MPDAELPSIHRHAGFDEAKAQLVALQAHANVVAYLVYGIYAPVSKAVGPGGLRYVIHPDGRPRPLFEVETELEADDTGRLGADPIGEDLELFGGGGGGSRPSPTTPAAPPASGQLLEYEPAPGAEPDFGDYPA